MHADGKPFTTDLRLKDTKTDREETYLQLEDDCWIRMDRMLQHDGHFPPNEVALRRPVTPGPCVGRPTA